MTETLPAIEVRDVVKQFGTTRALDGLSLSVRRGEVFGFLGPNGAGKTTLLRILLGLARPSSGTTAVHGAIGFVPDVPGFYPWMTAREFLGLSGRLFGLPDAEITARTTTLLDLAGLTGVDQPVGGYSRGMKQRLGIAQALINAPEVLLLDEPTSALDPIGRKDVLEMISALRGRTTVFFSTHILGDVERVCDSAAIVDHGRVVAQDSVEALRTRFGGSHRVVVDVTSRVTEVQDAVRRAGWAGGTRIIEQDGRPVLEIEVSNRTAAATGIPAVVAGLGVGLLRLEPVEASLEDAFVALVGERR